MGGGLLSFGSQSDDGPGGTTKTTSIALNPSVDVFVGDHLTLGFSFSAMHVDTTYGPSSAQSLVPQNTSGYALAAAPRIGRTIDLGPVTLWPKLGANYGVSRLEAKTPASAEAARTLTRGLGADLSVDVVFPVGRYLVLALGPTLSYEHVTTEGGGLGMGLASTGESDRIAGGVRAFIGVTF